jgi:hypothetical protein
MSNSLETQLGPSPMSSLGVVPECITSFFFFFFPESMGEWNGFPFVF